MILGSLLFCFALLISCSENNKKDEITPCSCMEKSNKLVEQIKEAGDDVDKIESLSAEMDELTKECEPLAKDDPEAWAEALADC